PENAGEVARLVANLRARADERARQAELERVAAEAEAREQRKRRRVQLVLALFVAALLLSGAARVLVVRAKNRARAAEDALEKSAATERVLAAEAEAERHASERDWPAAVAAIRRAADLAQASRVDDAVRERVEARSAALTAELAAAERDRR